jgi:hypothetical protein
MSKKFSHFAGDCNFKNMNVAVYHDNDNRILIAEKNGDEISRCTITKDEYASLRDEWTDNGRMPDNDVNVTIAALEYFGTFESSKPGAKLGNTNAQRGDYPATSQIQIRCTPAEKSGWVRAANGEKLSDWVRNALNLAAKNSLTSD